MKGLTSNFQWKLQRILYKLLSDPARCSKSTPANSELLKDSEDVILYPWNYVAYCDNDNPCSHPAFSSFGEELWAMKNAMAAS